MMRKSFAVALAGLAALSAGQAMAWGSTGHRIIGRLATAALPPEVPAFLRTPAAVQAMGELAREPDRWKGSGKTHDSDLDPGHFLDLSDDGTVLGGPVLANLPPTRAEYEAQLRAVGTDTWHGGYLPYAIVEGWQQLAKDFAYWRVDTAAAKTATDPARKAWYIADAAQRQELILRDMGTLGHYVGDGSQPLHMTVHFNGWGAFPNPNNYSQDKLHGPFEGAFVRNFVSPDAVRAKMPPMTDCACPVERRTADYLIVTSKTVEPFYQLYKDGAFNPGDARGVAYATERLAAGASELRDLVVLAWRASAQSDVGFPTVKVADVEAGKVDPYDALIGID